MSSAEHHADHHSDGHGDAVQFPHGTKRDYVTGFVLSVILTVIPFGVVMSGGLGSTRLTAFVVLACANTQMVVHMVYFLHMNSQSEEGWIMLATIFTIIVVVIMLAGSLWVMFHMNTNMMPQMNHEALQGFGS